MGLQMSPDIRRGDSLRHHEHLEVVHQLRNLLGRLDVRLVLRRHPDFRGFLDDLLADCVDATVEKFDRARPLRARFGTFAQLGEKLLEGLHPARVLGRRVNPGRREVRRGSNSLSVEPEENHHDL